MFEASTTKTNQELTLSWNPEKVFREDSLFNWVWWLHCVLWIISSMIKQWRLALSRGSLWVSLPGPIFAASLDSGLLPTAWYWEGFLLGNFHSVALGARKECRSYVKLRYTFFSLMDTQDIEISPLSSRVPSSSTAQETGPSRGLLILISIARASTFTIDQGKKGHTHTPNDDIFKCTHSIV